MNAVGFLFKSGSEMRIAQTFLNECSECAELHRLFFFNLKHNRKKEYKILNHKAKSVTVL